MAGYFSYFPKLVYNLEDNAVNAQAVTNILARSTFLKDVANNVSVYFQYQIKDSDTPEVIADKIYGDPYRAWLVLLFNNVINPNYDWPMKNDVLDNYVMSKYGQTLEEAKSEIHHYETEITNTLTKNGMVVNVDTVTHNISEYGFNFTTNQVVDRSAELAALYADTSSNPISTEVTSLTGGYTYTSVTKYKAVSNYTYELNQNEARRQIKLLDPAYAQQVEEEFKKLMRNG